MSSPPNASASFDAAQYSPLRADVMANPAISYAALQQSAPAHLCSSFEPNFYTLSRYDDVRSALLDIDVYSSEHGQGPRYTPPAGMLSDPPQHTHYRRLVQQAFTPKAIAAMSERVTALADELLRGLSAQQQFDLHDDFAFPLPVIIIAEMLGVPSEDLHRFKHWSDASVAAMGAEDPTPWNDDLAALGDYLLQHIRNQRATQPGAAANLTQRLVNARIQGQGLTDEEVRGVASQLLVGGNETTTSLITNAVWRLLEQPELWQQLVQSPQLVPVALEESLRFDPPVLGLYRTVRGETVLHGTTMPAGSKVMLHYAAANRDPNVFNDPDQFKLDRPAKKHLAFGLGVHFCLGAELARLEAKAALSALLRHYPDLELINDGERIAPFFLWGRRHLPVRRSNAPTSQSLATKQPTEIG